MDTHTHNCGAASLTAFSLPIIPALYIRFHCICSDHSVWYHSMHCWSHNPTHIWVGGRSHCRPASGKRVDVGRQTQVFMNSEQRTTPSIVSVVTENTRQSPTMPSSKRVEWKGVDGVCGFPMPEDVRYCRQSSGTERHVKLPRQAVIPMERNSLNQTSPKCGQASGFPSG